MVRLLGSEMEVMTDRLPQLKDILVYEGKEYVIKAIIVEENSYVLTELGVPESSAFVLIAEQLHWLQTLQAWGPVDVRGFLETDEA